MKTFTHIDANTIQEAVSALAEEHSYPNAGGTDIIGLMRQSIFPDEMHPKSIVNLKSITPSLDYIKEEGGVLKIGALARLEDIAESNIVKTKWLALAEAAHKTASPHIREMGTIGGNICQHNRCWYFWKEGNRFDCIRKGGNMCYALVGNNRYHSIFGGLAGCVAVNPSDTAPALVALNATIKTNKRDISADEFWSVKIPGSTVLDKGEIVTEVQLPAFSGKSSFVKFAIRSSIDFPVVNCAAAIGGGDVRICLNAVYGIPKRATAAEDFIKGKTINEDNADSAGVEAVKNATPLPYNKWKVQIAKVMVKRAILNCA
ncbi:MAG: FAD binding domain-containing protein [Dehalococcoidales bacterium]|nr:FAD binding domain-containing protein [Dehalococcoidales bacterium]